VFSLLTSEVLAMKILFLHGWESSPGGKKPSYFAEHGHDILNPALPADDFEVAVQVAQEAFDKGRPDLVMGSSRGGAVAMNLRIEDTPMLLICPAWKRWGSAKSVKAGTVIMHSPTDEIIPYAFSQELVAASPPAGVRLVAAGVDHRMAAPEVLSAMLKLAEDLQPHGRS
jgi:hypothetical protein